ncbi:hypothetical protein [Pseudomonas saliphila]|uniref:hypothetical protein n=1 Tax=Pseudomonas saliphila TaxID=2586906 RepID=UPI0012390420|nr:hypothetical protein [Pseudomonas saliphila]
MPNVQNSPHSLQLCCGPISITAPKIAFVASLLLSLVAVQFQPVLARDSALYVHMANLFNLLGYAGIEGQFDWPWVSIIISWVHSITKLSMINSGNLLMALFLAGSCAVMTKTTALLEPKAAYWGALVALTLPAFNGYRDVILREPGFWFFTTLATFWMVRWALDRQHLALVAALVAIMFAAVFRLEAILLIAGMLVTVLWIQRGWLRAHWKLSILAVTVASVSTLALLFWLVHFPEQLGHRPAYYLSLLDPQSIFDKFNATSAAFASAALRDYSHEHAGRILFWGFFMALLIESVLMLGPFVLIFLVRFWRPLHPLLGVEATFMIASAGLYFAVLMIFFVQQGFMTSRYTSYLHVLAAPLVGVLAYELARYRKAAGVILAGLAVLAGVDNVVSLSEKRTHYLDAATWIQTHLPDDVSIYFDDRRIGFYAGYGYQEIAAPTDEISPDAARSYDYLVIEQPSTSQVVQDILNSSATAVLAVFDNGARRHITIIGPKDFQEEKKAPAEPL